MFVLVLAYAAKGRPFAFEPNARRKCSRGNVPGVSTTRG